MVEVLGWCGGEGGGREGCPTGARCYRSSFSAPRFSDPFAD